MRSSNTLNITSSKYDYSVCYISIIEESRSHRKTRKSTPEVTLKKKRQSSLNLKVEGFFFFPGLVSDILNFLVASALIVRLSDSHSRPRGKG